jgi:hypothetical protein
MRRAEVRLLLSPTDLTKPAMHHPTSGDVLITDLTDRFERGDHGPTSHRVPIVCRRHAGSPSHAVSHQRPARHLCRSD